VDFLPLEHLTKPSYDKAESDQAAGQLHETQVDVVPAFPADE
jgi:hypothetical protein